MLLLTLVFVPAAVVGNAIAIQTGKSGGGPIWGLNAVAIAFGLYWFGRFVIRVHRQGLERSQLGSDEVSFATNRLARNHFKDEAPSPRKHRIRTPADRWELN